MSNKQFKYLQNAVTRKKCKTCVISFKTEQTFIIIKFIILSHFRFLKEENQYNKNTLMMKKVSMKRISF